MRQPRDYQSDMDSGGIKPGAGGGGPRSSGMGEGMQKTDSGSTANEGMSAAHAVSTVGQVTHKSVNPDSYIKPSVSQDCVPSGQSDIDPGGSEYSPSAGGKDQD